MDEIWNMTAVRNGDLSLSVLIDQLEARFAQREPRVRAFVPERGRFDRLRREAEQLLARFPHPADRPLLFGAPIGVKDIIYTAGFETRAGSRLPPQVFLSAAEGHGAEASCVSRLREAGALIVGKTVTTEFAYFGPGPTRNPHDETRTPGGSSSGSAAAVGAGLCWAALGTQTIGSVIRPAAFCGVVGFKPTYGRIATDGVIPVSVSEDHVGVLAADVDAAEAVTAVLTAEWRSAEVDPDKKPVLAVPDGPYLERAGEIGRAHLEQVVDRLRDADYEVKRIPALPDFAEIEALHKDLMAYEMAQVHADWFDDYRASYHPQTVDLVRRGRAVSAVRAAEARRKQTAVRDHLHALMDEHGVDLWLSPPAPGIAPSGLESTGDPIMNLPWTHAGLPTATVPGGWADGLPLGVQLSGRWGADAAVLAWVRPLRRLLMAVK